MRPIYLFQIVRNPLLLNLESHTLLEQIWHNDETLVVWHVVVRCGRVWRGRKRNNLKHVNIIAEINRDTA